ncbi:MAG: chemotaxis protein CheA, partial [Phycisphaerae bacterium]
AAAKTLRVDLNRLDNLMNLSGELVITKARFTDITRQLTGAISQNNVLYAVQDLEDRIAALHAGLKNSETPGSGLSTFADEVAHLQADFEKIKTIVQKFHSARPAMGALAEAVHGLDRVAGSMQKGIMETRMVAVGPLFQRFRRVVRDIAAQTNKKVDLELRGESTELDKRMIDELVDPLTHMIRNCVDHGIETPADRVKVGKPESGRVILNAFHRGRHICVEVRDDGKGLNIERIRAKIIERDLASARQVEQMTDKEAMQFIFKPGFSTAPQVTDLSGRGMGMDIVQTRIDELNGYVELNSTPGVGTVFTIQIPLTLAILNTMVVRIGCEVYAIPLENVREIITVPRDQLRTVQNQPVMEVRNRVIPLARLESLIHLSDPSQHTQSITNSAMTVLVLGLQGERMGLIADELIGQDDAVIKDIAANYRNVNGVTGASIRGDGRVSLILDVATLMSSFATRASQNTSFEALQPVMAKAAS